MIAGSGVQMEIRLQDHAATQGLHHHVGVTKDRQGVVAGKPVNPDELKARLSALKKNGRSTLSSAGDKDVSLQMLLGRDG